MARKRTAPGSSTAQGFRPVGFPDAPPFIPSEWEPLDDDSHARDNLHARAISYANSVAADPFPGRLAWAAYSAAQTGHVSPSFKSWAEMNAYRISTGREPLVFGAPRASTSHPDLRARMAASDAAEVARHIASFPPPPF